jgi:hypothetical protein
MGILATQPITGKGWRAPLLTSIKPRQKRAATQVQAISEARAA